MHARHVVPALDVRKHALRCRGSRGKVLAMGFLDLQRVPVTFHRRIVVTVPGAAHRLPHRLVNEPLAHFVAGVLAAAI